MVLTKWRHSTYLLELNDKVGVETLQIRCGLIPVYSPAAQTGEGSGWGWGEVVRPQVLLALNGCAYLWF